MKKLIASLIISFALITSAYANENSLILDLDTEKTEELDIMQKIQKSTVSIFSVNGGFGRCSGVLIKQEFGLSHIITAKHCIDIDEEIYVENIKVELIITAPNEDLAYLIIRRELENKISTKLATKNAEIGETIYHAGYPNWKLYKASGKVLKITEDWQLLDLSVLPGCSGGGVFNEDGKLLGILWGAFMFEPTAIMEPIEDINKFLHNIKLYIKWLNL